MTVEQILGITPESLEGMSRSDLYQLSIAVRSAYFYTVKHDGETREERKNKAAPIFEKLQMVDAAYAATIKPWEHLFGSGEFSKDAIYFSSLQNPGYMHTLEDVASADKRAQHIIKECETMIERLKSYRAEVALLYGKIATTPTVPGVELKRHIDYYHNNKVYYTLTVYTRVVDRKTRTEETTERFSGKERHKAIAQYKAYIRSHPGVETSTNIDGI